MKRLVLPVVALALVAMAAGVATAAPGVVATPVQPAVLHSSDSGAQPAYQPVHWRGNWGWRPGYAYYGGYPRYYSYYGGYYPYSSYYTPYSTYYWGARPYVYYGYPYRSYYGGWHRPWRW
jgi:hypothetical protein